MVRCCRVGASLGSLLGHHSHLLTLIVMRRAAFLVTSGSCGTFGFDRSSLAAKFLLAAFLKLAFPLYRLQVLLLL